MPCPTCSYTMQCVGIVEECSLFWCPRCGTIKTSLSGGQAPKLVERCRRLEADYIVPDEYPPLTADWRLLGVTDSILPEDKRWNRS